MALFVSRLCGSVASCLLSMMSTPCGILRPLLLESYRKKGFALCRTSPSHLGMSGKDIAEDIS